MTNNLCDLQYIDVVLSDESGNRSEVVQAVVDSGAEMCVARQDVIDSLDCLTVGKCKLRGIIGDLFDVEVKRLFIGTASGEKLVPVALACHELVHDPLLLTPAVVKCLISDDQCDHTDQTDCLEDSTGDNDGDEHDGDADNVDESTFEPCTELNVSTVDCSGLTTTIEPDCMKFIDVLSAPEETRAESKSLSVEQKQEDSLSHWWKMAEENKNGFFVHDDLLFRSERILGHTFKQLCVLQSRRNTVLDLGHNAVGAHMGIKQ